MKYLAYYDNKTLTPIAYRRGYEAITLAQMSQSTFAIIDLYYQYREEYRVLFEAVDRYGSLDIRTYPEGNG